MEMRNVEWKFNNSTCLYTCFIYLMDPQLKNNYRIFPSESHQLARSRESINLPLLKNTLSSTMFMKALTVTNGLTHWGRATHIYVSKLTIIASDNGLSPGRRQAIIWNNAGILSIGLSGTNFSEIIIDILTFSFKKMRLKMPSAKWRLRRHGLNDLNRYVFPAFYIIRHTFYHVLNLKFHHMREIF